MIVATIILFQPLSISRHYKITILGVALFIILSYFATYIENECVRKIVGIVSKLSYPMFLIHIEVERGLIRYFDSGRNYSLREVLILLIFTFAITFLLSIGLVKINRRIMDYIKKRKTE